MTMKKFRLIYTLLAVAMLSTACEDEPVSKVTPAADGSEIIFGGRAGFENSNPESRTIYSGETYTYNNVTYERIDWIEGDKIEIYCPEANNGPSAHYNITGFKANDENAGNTNKGSDYAYLTRIEDTALQWNGNGVHNFYAMYPSNNMFVNSDGSLPTVAQGIQLSTQSDTVIVKGIVPTSQSGEITVTEGNYTIAPNMKYAYMVAKSTATRNDGSVGLSFVPIVTAVEIELKVPASDNDIHPVSIAEIQVSGNGIAGEFTADLTNWAGTYPTCTNIGAGQGTIQISTWVDNKPITINEGKSITFTVFMRPGADPNNLKVSYSPTGSGYVNKSLQNVVIPRNLKTCIRNLYLPATYDEDTQITIDASKWMSQLAADAPMKGLSLPGTGGTFSYNYDSDNSDWYKQQTINFDEQWKLGIRAFEIVSDRPTSGSTSLGSQNVKCNKVSMGTTVLKVLQKLLTKVKDNPSETAVLILTYQPEGNSPNRNGAAYATSLLKMYDDLTGDQKAQIIQYTPDLTLGQARGNVMIFCRINQRDEKDNGGDNAFTEASTTLSGTNITLIDGCGTGKDRWGARGYKVNGVNAKDIGSNSDGETSNSVDYWMGFDRSGSGNLFNPTYTYTARNYESNVSRGELNFAFNTNYTLITCWYQEWARVVDLQHLGVTSDKYYEVSNTCRWYESYSEKVEAAEKTFDMAISGSYPNYIFINSLCGYLVDKSIATSYKRYLDGEWTNTPGGGAGNIKALADKINVSFYQHVLSSGYEQKTGPTGIVMMDYVSNTPNTNVEFDGSYYLPGVIIANNFKGNLPTNPNGGGGSGSGSDEGDEEEG